MDRAILVLCNFQQSLESLLAVLIRDALEQSGFLDPHNSPALTFAQCGSNRAHPSRDTNTMALVFPPHASTRQVLWIIIFTSDKMLPHTLPPTL